MDVFGAFLKIYPIHTKKKNVLQFLVLSMFKLKKKDALGQFDPVYGFKIKYFNTKNMRLQRHPYEKFINTYSLIRYIIVTIHSYMLILSIEEIHLTKKNKIKWNWKCKRVCTENMSKTFNPKLIFFPYPVKFFFESLQNEHYFEHVYTHTKRHLNSKTLFDLQNWKCCSSTQIDRNCFP